MKTKTTIGKMENVENERVARDRDFLRRCMALSRHVSTKGLSCREVAPKAAASPAPGYYISYDYALRIVGGGKSAEIRGSMPRQRNEEIRRRVREITRKRGTSKGRALTMVLESGASRFFISPKRAERMFYEYLNYKRTGGGVR